MSEKSRSAADTPSKEGSKSLTSAMLTRKSFSTPRTHPEADHLQAQTQNPISPSKPRLDTLPLELHFKIMSNLDPCNSACLGLTCKRLYAAHSYIHPKTSLFESTYRTVDGWFFPVEVKVFLFELLHGWFGEVMTKEARLMLDRAAKPTSYLFEESDCDYGGH